jgi:SAM-dependent methyltransferase
VVVLDPGLSFGTGQHPTTGFCLRELVRRRESGVEQSFLDLGTGSGILAIAAAKMGYTPVVALDFDPDCVRVAQNNARRNRVADRVTVRRGDVSCLSKHPRPRHDVVCANLVAPLLVKEADRIAAQVRPVAGWWLPAFWPGSFRRYTNPSLLRAVFSLLNASKANGIRPPIDFWPDGSIRVSTWLTQPRFARLLVCPGGALLCGRAATRGSRTLWDATAK